MISLKQLMGNFAWRENRPQWLIAPLPVQDNTPPAPPFSASLNAGGLLPNVAQNANAMPVFNTSPYHPYFSPDDFAAAQSYSQRVNLSPIGGSIDG